MEEDNNTQEPEEESHSMLKGLKPVICLRCKTGILELLGFFESNSEIVCRCANCGDFISYYFNKVNYVQTDRLPAGVG